MKTLELVKQIEEIVVSKASMESYAPTYIEDVLKKFFGKAFDGIKWCNTWSWLVKSYAHGAGCGLETNRTCDYAHFDYEYYDESNDKELVLKITMWKVIATEVERKY